MPLLDLHGLPLSALHNKEFQAIYANARFKCKSSKPSIPLTGTSISACPPEAVRLSQRSSRFCIYAPSRKHFALSALSRIRKWSSCE
ncbi:hypothetical protein BDN70DRAFT_977029 [Pholiota conissans]|uniref:Uncharacterized protein n=1 Tax=Pholiota conissans TaxID=109636 RepID=A0A9P5YLX3_9AGAR|nr:hypothetical protein BDN70DRAFT_977029 [Pholiota conissans]